MPVPYEGSVLANYALYLGARLAHTGSLVSGAINYLPAHQDRIFGDAKCCVRDRGVIIEFKREQEEWATEFEKEARRKLYENLRDAFNEQNRSRRAHWMLYGAPEGSNWTIQGVPYFDALASVANSGPIPDYQSLDAFVSALIGQDASSIGCPWDEFTQYLSFVSACADAPGADTSFGALFFADSRGRISFRAFESYSEISGIHSEWRHAIMFEDALPELETPAPEPEGQTHQTTQPRSRQHR